MRIGLVTFCVLLVAGSAVATPITVVSATPNIDVSLGMGGGLVESWTQTGTYSGVTITAALISIQADTTAYLMNQVGLGTTVANQLFINPVSSTTLFTGLTLGPGTYFLVVASPNNVSATYGVPPLLTTDAGVTIGSTASSPLGTLAPYAPATNFSSFTTANHMLFSVVGSADVPSQVPEPATLGMLSAGLSGLLLAARRRRA
jgi:hypothetical protein